jgi:hypothetical protein
MVLRTNTRGGTSGSAVTIAAESVCPLVVTVLSTGAKLLVSLPLSLCDAVTDVYAKAAVELNRVHKTIQCARCISAVVAG